MDEQLTPVGNAAENSAAGLPSRAPAAEVPKRPHSFRRKIFEEALLSVFFCAVMAALAAVLLGTSPGNDIALFTYRLLQGFLKPGAQNVVVVDIGNLAPDAKTGITSRNKLTEIITAIQSQARPKAIGIDIDFSPEEFPDPVDPAIRRRKLVDPRQDLRFFQFCKDTAHRGLPVFLGIYRSRLLSPAEWLGAPQYQSLAAALVVKTTPAQSIWSLSNVNEQQASQVAGEPPSAPSMSAALAALWQPLPLRRFYFFEKFVREKATSEVVFEAFHIDYSALERLPVITIPDGGFTPDHLKVIMSEHKEEIDKKAVLLGDVHNATDFFENVAGHKPLPGVLVHAAAVQTLTGSPLYAFPELESAYEFVQRWTPDFLFSVAILAGVILARLLFAEKVNEHRLDFLAFTGGALVIVLFGCAVNFTRVLWPDFLALAIGLALHPRLHRMYVSALARIGRWLGEPEMNLHGHP